MDELPAESVTVAAGDLPGPLAEDLIGLVAVPRRRGRQEAANATVTSALFQPFGLASDPALRAAVMVGAVLSILTPPTVAEFELPALSVR